MHKVLVNRLGGLSLPRKSVVRLTDRPDMTLDVYRGRKTTIQYNVNASNVFPAKVSQKTVDFICTGRLNEQITDPGNTGISGHQRPGVL